MPIYEYKCKNCNHKFEKLIFGEEEVKCPKCSSISLQKLISNVNISKPDSDNSESCGNGTCNICPTCRR